MPGDVVRLQNCPNCEQSIDADARFCSACGKRIRRKQDQPDDGSLREVVSDFVKGTAAEAKTLSADALKSDVGKKIAAGAALGAVAGAILPLIGPTIGATFGAGYVAFKRLTK